MKTIEEIRAAFTDEDGNVAISDLEALNEAIVAEMQANPVAMGTLTPLEQVAALDRHSQETVQFVVRQLFEVLLELRQVTFSINRSLAGDDYDGPSPEEVVADVHGEREGMLQAILFNRLATIYGLALAKTQKRIEVAR